MLLFVYELTDFFMYTFLKTFYILAYDISSHFFDIMLSNNKNIYIENILLIIFVKNTNYNIYFFLTVMLPMLLVHIIIFADVFIYFSLQTNLYFSVSFILFSTTRSYS